MLLHAVTAEQNLIWIYGKAIAEYSGLAPVLRPLRAQHLAHRDQLRARIVEPAGKSVPLTVTSRPALGSTPHAVLAQLAAAEQRAVARLLSRLGGASGSTAQLYASIAASESTHVAVLDQRAGHARGQA